MPKLQIFSFYSLWISSRYFFMGSVWLCSTSQELDAKRGADNPFTDESGALMLEEFISPYVKLFAKHKTQTSRF